jgi:predicted Zn-dependent peptidase
VNDPRRRASRAALFASTLLLAVAVPAAVTPAAAQSLEGRVREVTLDNGMRFLIVHRGTAPVFTGMIRFRVGSVDDPGGRTGLAHMFEHMAFKGTSTIGVRDAAKEKRVLDGLDDTARSLLSELDRGPRADAARLETLRAKMKALDAEEQALVVKDEFSEILGANGAVGLNASTSSDLTSYFVSLPANRLELWCLLESARLRDPVLREFYTERDVVAEERRYRIDTSPQGKIYEALLLAAFTAHPYRVQGTGWLSDLAQLTRPDAEAFRRIYYVPNNAVGALVGDVDPKTAEALLKRYFGSLPAGPEPAPPATVEPEQQGERRVRVEFDAEPQILIGYHKPALTDPEDPVYDVIDGVLSNGRTSRLFRKLVTEDNVAAAVYTFDAPGFRFPSLFVVGAIPRAPHTLQEVESAILKEMDRLGTELVGQDELRKIHNQVESAAIYDLRSSSGLASQLTFFEILTGDWRNLIRRDQALEAVSPAQVQAAARRTFTASNRTIAVLERPVKSAAPEGVPPAADGDTEPAEAAGSAPR